MTNTLTISREQLRQEFEAANSDRAWFVQGGTSESDTPEGFVYGDFTTDMCWTCYFEARRIAAPAVERQEPVGEVVHDNENTAITWLNLHRHPLPHGTKLYTSPPAPVAVDEPVQHDDWAIDHSAGRPVLVYKKCSVIEDEDAYYLLNLIQKDRQSAPVAVLPPRMTMDSVPDLLLAIFADTYVDPQIAADIYNYVLDKVKEMNL